MKNNFHISAARGHVVVALFACGLAASLLAGCQSSSVLTTEYISPRVTGKVLDAATRQPIANVRVWKTRPDHRADRTVDQPPTGDQALQDNQSVRTRTDRQGKFVLQCQRDMTVIRQSGWSAVTISFRHTDYAPFVTNYTVVNATPSSNGVPVIIAGDILLHPVSR